MLKIKNSNGEELMRLEDNGDEKIFDPKLREQFEKAAKEKDKEGE